MGGAEVNGGNLALAGALARALARFGVFRTASRQSSSSSGHAGADPGADEGTGCRAGGMGRMEVIGRVMAGGGEPNSTLTMPNRANRRVPRSLIEPAWLFFRRSMCQSWPQAVP